MSNSCQMWFERIFSAYRAILDKKSITLSPKRSSELATRFLRGGVDQNQIAKGTSSPADELGRISWEESVIFRADFVFVLLLNNNPFYLTFFRLRSKFNRSGKRKLSWEWNFSFSFYFIFSFLPSFFFLVCMLRIKICLYIKIS